ncbi:ferric reductase-like transmembrane domain-containing protein [Synechococcus sp. RS9916]|uniref:ferric reductase-like transmembrane domain-containing protein n=1 Tax=Synechococcus sp. RS9916 TaxID=221359 RepID=UPI001E383EF5|nr:ferric reductase-like transmembrane domain-containing protein [Synechococcus sp. RS9916]
MATLVILAGLGVHFGVSGWTSTSVKAGIDATGRSSLALFSIAFVASSVHRLWPSSLSQWMLQNRRWIGLSFASSHAIHLVLIIAMSFDFPDPFLSGQPAGKWLLGGIGYLFVALMAMTSSNAAQHWMGMKHWKRLHLIGSYWLWAQFFLTYVSHIKKGPADFYAPFLIFTMALLVIRWAGHVRPKRPLSPVG